MIVQRRNQELIWYIRNCLLKKLSHTMLKAMLISIWFFLIEWVRFSWFLCVFFYEFIIFLFWQLSTELRYIKIKKRIILSVFQDLICEIFEIYIILTKHTKTQTTLNVQNYVQNNIFKSEPIIFTPLDERIKAD